MIITWIVIGVIVVLALLLLRVDHSFKRVKTVALILIAFLIFFSVTSFFTSKELDLTSPRGVVNGLYFYAGWIGKTASNLWDVGKGTVGMVGNAIRLNDTIINSPMPR